MEQAREIIVIGGGLGGLCAAALLARAGRRVRVLEQAREPGGRARSRVQDGYVLNLGAHALYRKGAAMAVLGELGIEPRGQRVTGRGSFLMRSGQLHPLPHHAFSLLTSDLLDGRGKWQFSRALFGLGLGERKARRLRGRTVRDWLDAELPDARARALLETLVRLTCYAHAPELLAADCAATQVAEALRHGVMYVDGGWQTLTDAVTRAAQAAGAAIELGAAAERIEHAGGAVQAVITRDGRRLAAATVIAAVPPPALAALLPDDAHARRWADAAVPLRAACLDLGVRSLPHPERIAGMSLDAPLYYSNHSAYSRIAPDGASVLQLVRYLAPGEDGRGVEPELHAFLERIQPDVLARAQVKRFMPNLVVHNDLPGAERARPEHPELSGLHLVSDCASGRAMLTDAVLDSARSAALRIAAQPAGSMRAGVAAAEPGVALRRPTLPRPMAGADSARHTDRSA